MPITLSQARQNAINRRLNAVKQNASYSNDNLAQYDDQTTLSMQQEENPQNNGGFFGGVGYTLGKAGTGLLRGLEGIWDFVAGGVADLFGADEWAQEQMENSPFDEWNEQLDAWYNPNGFMSFVGDVAGGVGQMLPMVAANAIPGVGSALSTGMFVTSAAGQGVSDAVKQTGELGGKEWLYGTGSGAVEGAIEKVSGGIGGTRLGTVLGKNVAKSTAGKLAATFVGEGLEEVASDIVDPALRRVTGVDPNATVDVSQLPNTFLVGGTAGAILGGGSRLVNAKRAGGFNNLNAAEDANVIREARTRGNTLQAEGRLTDKWSDTLSKSEQEAAQRLSTRLQRMDADTRSQFITQNNLDNMFDANGALVENTVAEPQEYNRDAISYSARNLVGRTDANGNSVLKYAPTQNAVREDIAQATKDIAKLSNGNSQYVVVDTLTVPESGQKANAFYDNETGIMYIANDADMSEARSFVVSHEYVHSLEGSGQYSKYANEVLAEIAQSPEYREKYDYDKYYERYKQAHPNVEEETLNYIVETEMVADFTAKEILTNESAIRRLVNRDASLVRRIYEWVKEKIRQLSTGGGSRENVAYLRKAEKLLAKALDNPGGGVSVNEMDNYVREEKARRNNMETDVEAETAEAGEARRLADVRMSVQEVDGKPIVVIDTDQDIFEGVAQKDYPKVARRYMLDKFQGNVYPVGTSNAYVNRRSIEEYAYSANRRASQDIRAKKMQAGTELDNLLSVAQFIGHEADDGRHPDAVRGWDKYKTYFTFDGKTIFEGEISIKLLERGDLFYDMTKIKDTSTARAAGTATGSNSASDRDVSTNSIRDNAEKVKTKSQKNSDRRYSVSETDDKGRSLSKEQQEFFKDSKIREADGRLKTMYHGTAADFTVFDIAESGASNDHTSHIGFWFTPRKAVAENFAEFNANDYQGKKARVQEVYLNIENPKIYAPADNSARMEELRTENNRLREQLTKEYEELKETVGRLNYMLYFTEDNMFGRRGENDIGFRVDEDYYVQYMKMSPEQAKKAKSLVDEIKKNNKQIKANETEYYRLQDDDSFLQMSDDLDEFMEWITGTNAHERGFGREHYAATNAREAAEQFRNKLIKEGYDGIWIKDTRVDDSGDQIVAFSPEQIKLVANKQPSVNPDIRYSLSTDSQGNKLTQQQEEYFADSKIRDNDGNLLSLYHGSNAYEEIHVFKRGKNGYLGGGIYLTDSESYARRYADKNGYKGRIYNVYANAENPLIVTTDTPAKEILYAIYKSDSVYNRRSAKQTYETQLISSTDIKKLREMGYDAIVWNYGGSTEVSVFESNQIKLTSNKNPSANSDIRYSVSERRDDNYVTNRLKSYTYSDVDKIVESLTINKYGNDVVLRHKGNIGKQIYSMLNEVASKHRKAEAEKIARRIVYQELATEALLNAEEIENARRNGIEISETWIDKRLSSQLSETENEAFVRELRDELLSAFETTGKLNETGKMYLRYKDMSDRLRTVIAKEEVLKTARKLKKKNYPLAFEGFDSVKKALSKIEYRSDINKSSTRDIVSAFGQFYTAQNEALDGYYSNEVREAIDNFLNYNGKGDLDVYELEQLNTILQAADHLLRTYDKAFLNDRTISVTKTANEEIDTVKENAPVYAYTPLGRKGMLGQALRSIVDMRTLMRWVDGGKAGVMSDLFEQIAHGSTVQTVTVMDLNKDFEKFIKGHKKFYKELDKNIIFKFNGTDAEITRAEAISLYLTAMQEDGLYHLAFGGFAVNDDRGTVKRYYGKKPFYGQQEDVDAYEREALREIKSDMNALYEQLNETEKEYIGIARDLFNNKAKKIKQDVDMKRMGITNARVDNYFPMRVYERGAGAQKPAQGFIQELNLIANQSIHKDRVKGSKQTLLITPVNTVIMNHIRQISMYNAYAIPLDTFRRVLNKNVSVRADGKTDTAHAVTLKTTIQEEAWADFAKFIEKFEMDVQGAQVRTDTFDRAFRWIRSNYAKFQLGLNIKTMASQLTSLPMVGGRVGWGNLLKGTFAKPNINEMFEYSEWARARAYEGAAYKSQALVDNLDTLGQLAMKPIGWVDMFTMNRIYNAAKYYIASRDRISLDSVECKTKAAAMLEELGRQTQNNSEVAERSAVMRSGNEIMKSVVMFSSDAMKQFSTLVQAMNKISFIKRKIKKNIGNIDSLQKELTTARKEARQAFASVAASMTFYVLMGMLINYGLFAKEPEDDETLVEVFLKNLGGSVTGMIPIVRELYSFFVEGYELDNFAYDTFNGLTSAVKNMFDLVARAGSGERVTNQEWMLAMRKFIYAAGQVTGLPTRNIYNQMYGLIKRFSPSAAYEINSMFYGASTSDLTKAIEKDDDKLAATVTQQLLADKGIDANESVAEVFADLFAAGYSLPKGVPESVIVDGEEVTLNARQQGIVLDAYSDAALKAEGLISSEDFSELNDEEKASALKLLFNYYYYEGVNAATGAYADNRTLLLGKAIDVSQIAVVYGKLSELKADTDKAGNAIAGTKKAKVQRLVNGMKLTAAQKYILMGFLGYRNTNGESAVRAYVRSLGLTEEMQAALLEMCGYDVAKK